MATITETITIEGMFGTDHTYFNGSPVVIDIKGIQWNGSSPFNIVKVNVIDADGATVGDFHADTGGQSEISFDIQSALRSIWADYDFDNEVAAAKAALADDTATDMTVINAGHTSGDRKYREYSLQVFKEYLDSTDNEFSSASSEVFSGGKCLIGSMTEWERYNVASKESADASSLEHQGNVRFGDASTKPTASPERVGAYSPTSWVDVSNEGTASYFYNYQAEQAADSYTAHAPLVLRDKEQQYQDFLFVNRRGAVETCSALMKEALDIEVNVDHYNRVERPSFIPTRSLFAIASGGRKSWDMSSGLVDRYWAEWWTQEFLMSQRHWMRIGSQFVPVVVEPAKKSVNIYDRAKQQMPHVDFTVTMALEG